MQILRNIFVMLIFSTGQAQCAFEVLAESYIAVTQHKNANQSLRLEGAVSYDKPGTPKFTVTLASNKDVTVASTTQNAGAYDSSDLRDSISSTVDVVYDSDGDRNLSQNNALASIASVGGGGGGGCLLK
jgi:hypothetical protein